MKKAKILTVISLFITIFTYNGFSQSAGNLEQNPANNKSSGKSIAHIFLSMEKKFGTNSNHHAYLDSLLTKAKEKITPKGSTTAEAIETLTAIHNLLKDEGFIFRSNYLLNKGLTTKKIDCDNYGALYTAIAEILRIPVIPVYAPNHSFLRFYFKDGSFVNWEPINGKHLPNAYYIKKLNIAKQSIDRGVYLQALSKREFIGVQYNNIGVHLLIRKQFKEAIPYFNTAIKLYPAFSSAFHNRGSALYALKDRRAAITDLVKANNLDPNRATTHNTMGDIYFDFKDYSRALIHYKSSIKLDPTNFVPYHNLAALFSAQGKKNDSGKWLRKAKEIKQKYKRQ